MVLWLFISAVCAGSPAGWSPLGDAALPESTLGYRDGSLDTGLVLDFDVALDNDDRVIVAAIETLRSRWEDPKWARLLVYRATADGWDQLPPLTLGDEGLGEDLEHTVAVGTDAVGSVVVAVRTGSRILRVFEEGSDRWTELGTVAVPDEVFDFSVTTVERGLALLLAVRGDDDDRQTEVWSATMSRSGWTVDREAVGHSRRSLVSVHGRAAWTLYDREGRVVATWPAVPPPEHPDAILDDTRSGWRWRRARESRRWVWVHSRGGHGRSLVARGIARYVPTHYSSEINRLRIRRRLGLRSLVPPGQRELPVPHTLGPKQILLETSPPMIITHDGSGRVAVVRWTGRTWWGHGQEPRSVGGLGDPRLSSYMPRFVDGAAAPTLRYFELTEGRGYRVTEQTYRGRRWARTDRLRPGTALEAMVPTGRRWMYARGEYDAPLLVSNRSGTWDRVWGAREDPVLYSRHGAGLRPIPEPPPELCGHDWIEESCQLWSHIRLPSGDLLALVRLDPADDGVYDERWRLLRWTSGRWILEPAPALDASTGFENPQLVLAGTTPILMLADDEKIEGTYRVHRVSVLAAGTDGWHWLEGGSSALETERVVETNLRWSNDGGVASSGTDGALWMAWQVPSGETDTAVAVASWTGQEWVRRDAGLPSSGAVWSSALDVGSHGGVALAYAASDGVWALVWSEAGWIPLGEGPLWRGHVFDVDVEVRERQACVAWSGDTALAPQIGVACHPLPALE